MPAWLRPWLLPLEGRFEDYTIGKDITLERVNEITAIAEKHGFRLSGFRSFEREVTEEQIEIVRRNAHRTTYLWDCGVFEEALWENPDCWL